LYSFLVGGIIVVLISVIIPCYNVEPEIDRMMESIISQTVGIECMEIILVNDASEDGTWERLLNWEKHYEENVILVNCDCHGGPGAARNIGIDIAQGEYISFLDGDDWLVENYYERMLEIAQVNHSDIVICGHDRPTYFDKTGLKSKPAGKENNFELCLPGCRKEFLPKHIYSTSVCWVLYHREFIAGNRLYFPEGIVYEDAYFAYMSFMLAGVITECSDVLYHYYRNMHGIMMGGGEGKNRERLVGLRMFYDECKVHGWLEDFSKEIELIFIRKYYVEMMEVMFRKFQKVDYSVYLGVRDWMLEHFPDCIHNPYLGDEYSQMDHLFLKFIKSQFSENQIQAARKVFLSVVYRKDHLDSFCPKESRQFLYPQKEEMFAAIQELLEGDFSEDEFKEKLSGLQYFPMISKEEDVLQLCQKKKSELPGNIYRYIIEREFVVSYLKECILGKMQVSQNEYNLYQRILQFL